MKELNMLMRKTASGGHGIFTTVSFDAGEVVRDLSDGEHIDHPTRTSIQVGPGVHIEDEIGSFINHSCSPTCVVEGPRVVALVDIEPGDEVTFNYTHNEDSMASPFVCECCQRLIAGKH